MPARLHLRRWLARHRAGLYGLTLLAATCAALVAPAVYVAQLGVSPAVWLLALVVTALPASVLGVTFVHWLLTELLRPRVLPKLDFEQGIPTDCRTAVVVPCLAGSAREARDLLEQLATPRGLRCEHDRRIFTRLFCRHQTRWYG